MATFSDRSLLTEVAGEAVILSYRPTVNDNKPISKASMPLTSNFLRRKAFLVPNVEHYDDKLLVRSKSISEQYYESPRSSVTVIESEILESDSEDESDGISTSSTLLNEVPSPDIVRQSFKKSQPQWIDDPVIAQWRQPSHNIHQIITAIEVLHRQWSSEAPTPLSPLTDNTWLQVGQVLARVGLPWHNNQINMPNEIDTSWPFHFKSFEIQVIKAKGKRVGDPNASGYVCTWGEANCYGIRALQQELRQQYPNHKPLLVYDQIDPELVSSAEKLLGLQSFRIDLSEEKPILDGRLQIATLDGLRPVLFAATLGSKTGCYDDLASICDISETFPLILHVDASRTFDYITTMIAADQRKLGIENLTLGVQRTGRSLRLKDGSVLAGTIVAGGSNYTDPAPVVALKPLALGAVHSRVAYTRASDSTLAGSRDAIAPLWVALQEIRFGEAGFQRVFQYCTDMRKFLVQALQSLSICCSAPVYSLDIIIENLSEQESQQLVNVGGIVIESGRVLLTVQPSIKSKHVGDILGVFAATAAHGLDMSMPSEQDFTDTFPVPEDIVKELQSTINSWKVATRSAAGYPFHMGSYSALGPIIGNFLDLSIPREWVHAKANDLLDSRLRSFGVNDSDDRSCFKGAFTNGSTMGNRVGIHTALTHFPGAFLYFSCETHYSVCKTARDCDTLTNRWSQRSCRYSEISCNEDGSMNIDLLVQQALLDQNECHQYDEQFRVVLFLNMGTTFVGARDNINEIRQRFDQAGLTISYIHLDGALDFGFHNSGIMLGPPGQVERNGHPVVQGVTLSHHKALGNMVSGEVLCYSPSTELATLASDVDPRAVFETWLYAQVYTDTDRANLLSYCQENASRLEADLNRIGTVTKRNGDSTIVVLERPPAWIIEEFSLRPEGDWVHFITMPHISPNTVDLFVNRIAGVDRQCDHAFEYVLPSLSSILDCPLRLERIQCRSRLAEKVAGMAQSLVPPMNKVFESVDGAVRSSLRGAMTVVAVNEHDEPIIVFLAESTRDRAIRAGPVILRLDAVAQKDMVVDVGRQLVGFMARHLDVRVEVDELSYLILSTK